MSVKLKLSPCAYWSAGARALMRKAPIVLVCSIVHTLNRSADSSPLGCMMRFRACLSRTQHVLQPWHASRRAWFAYGRPLLSESLQYLALHCHLLQRCFVEA